MSGKLRLAREPLELPVLSEPSEELDEADSVLADRLRAERKRCPRLSRNKLDRDTSIVPLERPHRKKEKKNLSIVRLFLRVKEVLQVFAFETKMLDYPL